MPPAISVIVVSWNGENVVEKCLQSILRQTFPDFELIVVDNGSGDQTGKKIKSFADDRLTLIENKANLGFAAANNIGFAQARGKYIALLNQDAYSAPDWLEELHRIAEVNPAAGMVASKVLRPGSPAVIDSAGLAVYPDGLNRTRGGGESDEGCYDRVEEVFAPSGSAAFYRREMIEQTGFFDPECFLYGEDIDLGFRARLQGWTCLFNPRAVAYHPNPARPAISLKEKSFYVERNRIRVALKYFPLPLFLAGVFFFTPKRYLFQAWSYRKVRGPAGEFRKAGGSLSELVRTALRAYFSAGKDLAALLEERNKWKRARTVRSREISSWFDRFGISASDVSFQE